MKKKNKEEIPAVVAKIKEPNIRFGEVWIRGTSPLVIHAFSKKARDMMRQKMMAGSASKKNTKKDPRDFKRDFQEARHISLDGWDGIPAAAFKSACIQACSLVGIAKTITKITLFIESEGYDRVSGHGLVKIYGGEPEVFEDVVRVGTFPKVADLCVRPRWIEWGAKLRVKYDADVLTPSDIVNLISRAGAQIGVCEGRPGSTSSAGMGWGTFEVVRDKNDIKKIIKLGGK